MKLKMLSSLLVAFCILSTVIAEENVPTLSILDFAASGISDKESLLLVDYLSSVIQQSGQYRVIDRSQRETILKELQFSLSGCSDEACQLEAGRLLQARYIIVGSVGSVGSRFLLNMRLIDVETGEAIKTSSSKYDSVDSMIDDSENLAKDLLKTGNSAASAISQSDIDEQKGMRRGSSIGPVIAALKIVDNPIIFGISGSYLYQLNNAFSIGGWGGLIMAGSTVAPTLGLHLVFGNKVDGIAFGIDLGFTSGLSVYYRNFNIRGHLFPPTEITGDQWLYGLSIGYGFYLGS
jgi:TolB-like protein